MAHIKQQAKRNLTNEKKRLANAAFKSSVKSAIKNVDLAVASKNAEAAKEAYNFAAKKLDKALSKGIFYKNHVSRMKSHLAKSVNSLA